MLLIHTTSLTLVERYKAPIFTMFKIDSIFFNNLSAVSGQSIKVMNRRVDNETRLPHVGDVIAKFSVATTDRSQQITNIDEKSKWLTIGTDGANPIVCDVFIYGDIVPATKRELIIEWFRKR